MDNEKEQKIENLKYTIETLDKFMKLPIPDQMKAISILKKELKKYERCDDQFFRNC